MKKRKWRYNGTKIALFSIFRMSLLSAMGKKPQYGLGKEVMAIYGVMNEAMNPSRGGIVNKGIYKMA